VLKVSLAPAATATTPTTTPTASWWPGGSTAAAALATEATTTAATAATASVPTASASITTAAAPTAAARGRTPLTSNVDGDRSAIESRAVQRLDGALGIFVRPILDETKATGLPRGPVDDDASRSYLAELGEGFLKLLVHRRVSQIAHIQPVSHYYSISIAWHRIRSASDATLGAIGHIRMPPYIGSSQRAERELERAETTGRNSAPVSQA
jgi:hypothetical protein